MPLPVTLAAVLARVESGGRLDAARFEPATYANMTPDRLQTARAACVAAHDCSEATANMILACSWGRYQLMGFNVFGSVVNSKTTIWNFLLSAAAQDMALNRFLAPIKHVGQEDASWITNDAKRATFASLYNGPGNVSDYAAKLLFAYKALAA